MEWILMEAMSGASIRFRIVSITRRQVFTWAVEWVDMLTGREVARVLDPEADHSMKEDVEAIPITVTSLFIYLDSKIQPTASLNHIDITLNKYYLKNTDPRI